MSMVEIPTAAPPLDERIETALSELRRRIRAYIVAEGSAAVVAWLIACFWIGWAVDYLPVLAGSGELPQAARGVLLAVAAVGAIYLAYTRIIDRLLVPLSDRSLAILLERQRRDLNDALVTTVERSSGDASSAGLTQAFLHETSVYAANVVGEIIPAKVFNSRPLMKQLAFAVPAIASLGIAAYMNRPALSQAAQRLVLLDDRAWLRYAKIELAGIEVRRSSDAVGVTQAKMIDGTAKVPRGSNVTLRIAADASAQVVPANCLLRYRTDDGDWGTATIRRVGRPREGVQGYMCDSKPLAGLLTSMEFDVMGYDHRIGPFRLEAVDSPEVTAVTMDLRYPDYMVDEAQAIRTPRSDEPVLPAGNSLPQGTEVTLHWTSTKPLESAEIRVLDPNSENVEKMELKRERLTPTTDGLRFDFPLGKLSAPRTLEVTLLDTDGVTSERAQRIFFTPAADEPPRVEIALQGIGPVVTPQAILPFTGTAHDDYGIARVWLELSPNDSPAEQTSIELGKVGAIQGAIDLKTRPETSPPLTTGGRLSLVVKARDRFDLTGEPNVGTAERYQLEIVTPDQLLAGLEARELAMRRRFEQIMEELTDMRDSLLHIRPGEKTDVEKAVTDELGEGAEKKLSPEETSRRLAELRLLRAERAIQQSKKSSQEVVGIAQAFESIREELINNRVDTEDRKTRLKEQIADPLRKITAETFVEFDTKLISLSEVLEDAAKGPPAAEAAVIQANLLLAKLDEVLQRMLKLESYNDLVDQLRDLIEDQRSLIDETKKRQRRDLED